MSRALVLCIAGVLAAAAGQVWVLPSLLAIGGPAEDLAPLNVVRLNLLLPTTILCLILAQLVVRPGGHLGTRAPLVAVLGALLLSAVILVCERVDMAANESTFTVARSAALLTASVAATVNVLRHYYVLRSPARLHRYWALVSAALFFAAFDQQLSISARLLPALASPGIGIVAVALLALAALVSGSRAEPHRRISLWLLLAGCGGHVAAALLRAGAATRMPVIAAVDLDLLVRGIAAIVDLTSASTLAVATMAALLQSGDGVLLRRVSALLAQRPFDRRFWQRAVVILASSYVILLVGVTVGVRPIERAFLKDPDGHVVEVLVGRSHGLASPDGFALAENGLYLTFDQPPTVAFVGSERRCVVLADGASGLRAADSLAVDATGTVFVVDDRNRRIHALTAGRLTTAFDASDGLVEPKGVAIGPGNALFVSDLALATVFRHDGGRLAVWANASAGLTAPEEMAFDDRGNLYVTEETPGHVLRITPNGAHEVFAGRASGLRSPEDVCVHGDHVYVADAAGPSVFRFDLSGDGGRILTLTEEFRSLESIEVDADGTMLLGIRRRRPLPSYVLAVRPRR